MNVLRFAFLPLLALGVASAEQCRTFNFKYKVCLEDWVSEDVMKAIPQGMENNNLRSDFNFKKQTKGDTVVFIVSTKSDETIEFLTRLPAEMKQELPASLGQTYGNLLGGVAGDYFRSKVKEFEALGDDKKAEVSYLAWLKRFKPEFQFDLYNGAGKLAKSYDLTEHVVFTHLVSIWRKEAGLNEP